MPVSYFEPHRTHPIIAKAVGHFGSQGRLAKAIGSSQSAVSRMLLLEIPVPAEVAMAIDQASGGAIPRWKIRPDLWEAPMSGPPSSSEVSRLVPSSHLHPHECRTDGAEQPSGSVTSWGPPQVVETVCHSFEGCASAADRQDGHDLADDHGQGLGQPVGRQFGRRRRRHKREA